MMAGGVQSEPLAVEHVGEPRQRQPVAGHYVRERPFHARPRQPGLHLRVGGQILIIIQCDEVVMNNGPIQCERSERQNNGNAGQAQFVMQNVWGHFTQRSSGWAASRSASSFLTTGQDGCQRSAARYCAAAPGNFPCLTSVCARQAWAESYS